MQHLSLSLSMARPLQEHPTLTSFSTTTTLLFVLASIAAIASIVISLCTSHKHSKMARDNKGRAPSPSPDDDRKLLSGFSNKALVVAKMVSWKKGGEAVNVNTDEALWKKTIMMGEKCRPLDFSGQIAYDSEGNQLPEIPSAAAAGGGRGGGSGVAGKV